MDHVLLCWITKNGEVQRVRHSLNQAVYISRLVEQNFKVNEFLQNQPVSKTWQILGALLNGFVWLE